MKKRSRDINIFSMSALDLFASGMGAFILLAVMALPFFPNTGDSQDWADAQQEELDQTRAELQQCQTVRDQLQGELDQCRSELRKKFLLIVMSWPSGDDVDLHVVDPQGREYYYDARRFPGSQAALEEDNIQGPGNEIWLHPESEPGDYKVYFNYYAKRSNGAEVRSLVIYPDGKHKFPDRRLTRQGEKPHIATITIDNNGNVSVRNI